MMSDTEKIQAIFGMSLTDMMDIMSISVAAASQHEITVKFQVFQTLVKAGMRLRSRQDTDQALKRIEEALDERAAKRAAEADPPHPA